MPLRAGCMRITRDPCNVRVQHLWSVSESGCCVASRPDCMSSVGADIHVVVQMGEESLDVAGSRCQSPGCHSKKKKTDGRPFWPCNSAEDFHASVSSAGLLMDY